MSRNLVSANALKVQAALMAAANNGEVCPTNQAICDLLGAASTSSAVRYFDELAAAGIIRIERGQRAKVVEIVATGKRTAGKAGNKHWRERDKTPTTLCKIETVGDSETSDGLTLADAIDIEAIRSGTPRAALVEKLLWQGWACYLDGLAA